MPRIARAFTLVELLVVIGIIGVLVALLLPALSRARSQARVVACSSQLRSMGQGLFTYAVNSRGWLPAWSGWHTIPGDGTGEDAPGEAWTEQLAPYFVRPTSQAFNCPSFPEERKINYFLTGRYSHHTGRRSMRFGEIRTSAHFVLGGDCTQAILYPAPFGSQLYLQDDADKDDATHEGVVFAGQPGGLNIHDRRGNNVLFADGHVGLHTRFEPAAMTYHARLMKRHDELGAPGLALLRK